MARYRKLLRLSHTRFSIAFALCLYGLGNAPHFDKLARWFHRKEGMDYPGLASYLVVGLCLFIVFFVLLAHRRTVKPVAIALVVASAAATYFISKYNIAIDGSMVRNVMHTDLTEVRELLSLQMIPYAVLLALLPAIIILSLDITFQPNGRYLLASLTLAASALLVAIAALYLNYNATHRAGNVSSKYIVHGLVPINLISSTISVAAESTRPLLASGKKEIA